MFNLSDMAASYVFVIFFMQGLEQAALLSVAANLVRQVLTYLYTPMQGLQVPLFTRARADEGATLPGAYAAVCRLLLLLLVPGSIGLMTLAQPLVLAQYPKYAAAVGAIVLLTPLLFAESLLATSQNALMVSERYKPIIISRTLAFSSIPLAAILVPMYGVLGAAAAIGGARILAGLVVFVAGQRLLDLRFPWSFAGRLLAASAVMSVILLPLTKLLPDTITMRSEQLTLFVATMGVAAVGGAAFLIVFRLLGGLDQRDRQQLATTRLPFKQMLLKVL
jgi:O-antigen/teichoic acid export membrane protein